MTLLLGIDAGTTSLKTALFSPDGHCLGIQREEYSLDTPSVEKAQLDPHFYWDACVRTIHALLNSTGCSSNEIAALSVSSQGETFITLDARGEPIYPAIVWLDNRASAQAERLAKKFGTGVYQKTGIPEIIPTWTACKILWLKENEPDVFQQAAKFLLVEDYILYRLTGKYASDGSIACTTLYYDIVKKTWWDEMLQEIGITQNHLPELHKPGMVIGNIQESAAQALGLSTQTKVVNGGMDQAVGAIGAGNIQAGIISETTGSALAIQVTVEQTDSDPQQMIPVYVHSIPDQYLLVPVCPTAGMAFKWFRDQFAVEEIKKAIAQQKDNYDLLTELAATVPPGCDGLLMLPNLMGSFSPEINPTARGSFTGFTLSHTRAHFARAVMEGVAFLLKRNVEYIEKAGISIHEIISTGGGSRSRLWNQIKADVCEKPVVTLQNEETGLLGNAILAGTAAGIFPSIQAGCQKMVAVKEKYDLTENAEKYVQPYRNYVDLEKSLDAFFIRAYLSKKEK